MLTPAKTEGPYFLDEKLERSDIRVDPADGSVQTGIPLALKLIVLDQDIGSHVAAGNARLTLVVRDRSGASRTIHRTVHVPRPSGT